MRLVVSVHLSLTTSINMTTAPPKKKIKVNMVAAQAHAPVFKAKLSVCEGLVVTATGSSKKIAKNLAAAEMVQKDWFLWNIYDGLLLNMQDRQCSIP